MKKQLIALALAATSFTATADTIAGIYLEGRITQVELTSAGSYNSSDNAFSLTSDKEQGFYVSARIEHPIPLVPNLKLSNEQFEVGGTTTGMGFEFDDVPFNTDFNTNYDVNETTATLYYEFLDFDTITLDAGLSVKMLTTDIMFSNDASNESASIDAIIPMGYVAIGAQLPMTGFKVGAQIEMLEVGDHSVESIDAFVGYEFMDNMALDLTVKFGYTSKTIDLDDLDGFTMKNEFDGLYLGLEAHL